MRIFIVPDHVQLPDDISLHVGSWDSQLLVCLIAELAYYLGGSDGLDLERVKKQSASCQDCTDAP